MNSTNKLLLLDAYALIYRAYYALIRNPRLNSKGLNTSAIFGFVNTLEDILKKEQPDFIGVAFDPHGPTFRHEVYEQYKAQRQETPEDIRRAVPIIKDIIRAYNIPILEVEGYEADDVIGTLATQAGQKTDLVTYMMTPDKDYGQLVNERVLIYRPKYGDKEFEIMGVEQVCHKFGISHTGQIIDLLGLMGDSSDNIPGCPGVGEKTAQKLISEFGSIDELLDNTSKIKGALRNKIETNVELIRFSKFLATIKTDVPINLDLELLSRKEINVQELKRIFGELEFRTLAERVFKREGINTIAEPAKRSSNTPIQGELFAIFPDQSPSDEKKSQEMRVEKLLLDYQSPDFESVKCGVIQNLLTTKTLAFWLETQGKDTMDAVITRFHFAINSTRVWEVTLPPDRLEAWPIIESFKPVFENEQSVKVSHDLKPHMLTLLTYGIDLRGSLFDLGLAQYVLQPEIKAPTEAFELWLDKKEELEASLRNNNLDSLFYDIEIPLVPILADMEYNGVRVDRKTLKNLSIQFTDRLKELEEKIFATTGGISFNINSPRQVGELLFDRLKLVDNPKKTKTGQYLTSEEVLESLRDKHEAVGYILAHRGLKKLVGTYVDALPQLINSRTGKIHTSFNQSVTATGRLSSSNPNLQNIPIRDEDGKEIRKAFVPDARCSFFSADYSQIELRIMAHLSKDPHMIKAFQSGYDIHAATAAQIYKIPIDEVTSDMRRKAKTANFGIIYGISAFGLAERLGIDRREARDLIQSYFATYPDVKQYIDNSIEQAHNANFVETIFHRRRYLADINSGNAVVRGYAERNAVNAPIQGSAADIIKIAMIRIFQRFQKEGIRSKMILQVHDELNFNVLDSEKEKVERIVIEEMEHAADLSVPLRADCGWGNNWLEAH